MNNNNVVNEEKKKKEVIGLLDIVFSWSLKQALNKNHYKDEVKQIPDKFSSTVEYFNSFKLPLIEETRADFHSGLESVSKSPASEVSSIRIDKHHKPPKGLHYRIRIKPITDSKNPGGHYKPQSGDVFAFTNIRPRDVSDLIRPGRYIVFAFVGLVSSVDPFIPIVPSEELDCSELLSKGNRKRLFATFVMNLTTNLRIWRALRPDPRRSNLSLIENVLQYDASTFRLDEAQTDAVLNSVSVTKCTHQKETVNLIWGPPGTGKTKTFASLLFALLKLKCRTLTCAPTNIAVVTVAKRLVNLFRDSVREYDTSGLGDILLIGNGDRMKIDEHQELVDVFLNHRVEVLVECLCPLSGWKYNLVSMIGLLENARGQYNTYLARGDIFTDDDDLEKNKKKTKRKEQITSSEEVLKTVTGKMTFEEFVMNTFAYLTRHLVTKAKNLYTHLPTSILPVNVVKQMIELINLLKTLENSTGFCRFSDLMKKKEQLLRILKGLL